jgi:hypothetical protein
MVSLRVLGVGGADWGTVFCARFIALPLTVDDATAVDAYTFAGFQLATLMLLWPIMYLSDFG